MSKHIQYLSFCLLFLPAFQACSEEAVITPRPRAYPKVELPEKVYRDFGKEYCEFDFQYPVYAEVIQDTSFFEEKPAHSCWFDILYPFFDARLHFTYAPVGSAEELSKLKNDAFKMADWQNKKANYIQEIRIDKPENEVKGIAFDITGPAASPFQFYLTDDKKHFVRASLYFNTHINPDSLAPMYDFVKMDITQMINTFKWE